MFLICSFFGWINETIIKLVSSKRFIYRGSLFEPLLPIYGVGALIVLLIFKKYKKYPTIIFFLIAFLMGLFEFIMGLIIDKIFHKELWDYSDRLLNINGYVCLYSVFFFGVSGLLLLYFFEPFLKKIFYNIKSKYINIFVLFSFVFLIIDIIMSYFFKY